MHSRREFLGMQEEILNAQENRRVVAAHGRGKELQTETKSTTGAEFVSFRSSLQELMEKIDNTDPSPESLERVKQLRELLPPELQSEFKHILQEWKKKGEVHEGHPLREYVNIENPENVKQITTWLDKLEVHVRTHRPDAGESEIEELRRLGELYFEATAHTLSSRSLEADVRDFYRTHPERLHGGGKERIDTQLKRDILGRYPITGQQAEILVDLVLKERFPEKSFSLKQAIEVFNRVWSNYHLSEQKGVFGKVAAGYLLVSILRGFSPSINQHLINEDGSFHLEAFLGFLGLNQFSVWLEGTNRKVVRELLADIDQKISERVVASIFFNYELMGDIPLTKLTSIIGRGKEATKELSILVFDKIAPTAAGLASSLTFLSLMNPRLGLAAGMTLPLNVWLAHRQGQRRVTEMKTEREQQERASTELENTTRALEDLAASPYRQDAAEQVGNNYRILNELSVVMGKKRIDDAFLRNMPDQLGRILAAIIAAGLQEKAGVVIANMSYADQLRNPILNLIDLYSDGLPKMLDDIGRLEELLGPQDSVDSPDGKRESERVPVTELSGLNIHISNLNYKGILKGVNADIPEGSFVAIVGRSGGGKTTLIKNIGGLVKPDEGVITIGGVGVQNIKKYGPESLYSVLAGSRQNQELLPKMNLRENILLWNPNGPKDEEIKTLLQQVGLEKFTGKLDQEITYMSGGEKVRLGIVRALVRKPKILYLDEPTSSLDAETAKGVRELLAKLHDETGITILCVTHDEELIAETQGKQNQGSGEKKYQVLEIGKK